MRPHFLLTIRDARYYKRIGTTGLEKKIVYAFWCCYVIENTGEESEQTHFLSHFCAEIRPNSQKMREKNEPIKPTRRPIFVRNVLKTNGGETHYCYTS